MSRRSWGWMALAVVAISAAVATDLFLFPAPRSSRVNPGVSAGPQQVSVSPPLRAGAPFAERLLVTDGKAVWTLALTGSYVRSRNIILSVDLYEVASYTETPPRGSKEEMLESLWRQEGRKAYVLRFLKPVPGWRLRKAVQDEMARSFNDLSMDDYREDIDRLLQTFEAGAHRDDVFYLVRLPPGKVFFGMRSERNLSLATSSPPLARAIWRMWAGPTAEPGRAGLIDRLNAQRP